MHRTLHIEKINSEFVLVDTYLLQIELSHVMIAIQWQPPLPIVVLDIHNTYYTLTVTHNSLYMIKYVWVTSNAINTNSDTWCKYICAFIVLILMNKLNCWTRFGTKKLKSTIYWNDIVADTISGVGVLGHRADIVCLVHF